MPRLSRPEKKRLAALKSEKENEIKPAQNEKIHKDESSQEQENSISSTSTSMPSHQ